MNLINDYQYYLSLDENSKINDAKNIVLNIFNSLDKVGLSKDTIQTFITELFAGVYSSDLQIKKEEYKFFSLVTNFNIKYNNFCSLVKNKTLNDIKEYIDNLVDKIGILNLSIKNDIIKLIICICSINGKISIDEQNFIRKILY